MKNLSRDLNNLLIILDCSSLLFGKIDNNKMNMYWIENVSENELMNGMKTPFQQFTSHRSLTGDRFLTQVVKYSIRAKTLAFNEKQDCKFWLETLTCCVWDVLFMPRNESLVQPMPSPPQPVKMLLTRWEMRLSAGEHAPGWNRGCSHLKKDFYIVKGIIN